MKTPARRALLAVKPPFSRSVGGAVLAALTVVTAVTACSSPYGSSSATPPVPTTTTIVGADTPALTKAATLRAKLTYLMVEHAFLFGRAVAELTKVPGYPHDDATANLDANGKDISDLLGQAYGGSFGSQFSGLWKDRSAALLQYAQAKAAGNASDAALAITNLATNVTSLAQLIHTTNKYLEIHTVSNPPTGIGDELTSDNQVFQNLVDVETTNDPTLYAKLVTVAETMPHTAEVLAAATAKLYPDTYPGTATGTAANLRSSLTELVVEHVGLVSVTGGLLAGGNDAGPAAAALTNNSTELHNAVASIYGDTTAAKFDDAWGSQIQEYTAYAKAKALLDSAGSATAASQLDTSGQAFGAFISTATASRVAAGDVAGAFSFQVKALEGVIDGAATKAPDGASRMRSAAGAVPGWTAKFAEAVAEQFPTRYLP